ncbi:MAG: FprA family A-type flavoprotein [bacterium]|nr:FprA family A-type flavoprotein [bacterium]
MKAVKITDTVYWVGAVDWGVRNFHGYTTDRGTTYNAYLVMADKITLVDFVKKGFEGELLSRISSVVDPKKIDYIISNHSEPDHSGTLPEIVKEVSPEKIFASPMGVKALKAHFGDYDITPVKDGEEISLGNRTVKFMETRMLHWPDSMFSYIVEEKFLFSQDAFGMHLASSERFDDELPWELLRKQTEDYYANIITLYSPHVARLLEKVSASGMEFKYVAPDHGPVWRNMESFGKILSLYKEWSSRKFSQKVVLIYDTMWKSTELMARYIEDGVKEAGVKIEVMPLYACERSTVASQMLDAAAVIVGAPTLNNNIYPSIADVLTYVRGLKFKTPFGAAFGSYGWSGEGNKQIKEYLNSMDVEILGEVKGKYVPDDAVREACMELGKTVAGKVKETIS